MSGHVSDPLARALGAVRTRRGVAKAVAGGLVLAGTFAERWNALAQNATPDTCPATTPEENKALVGRYWTEVWTAGGEAAIPAVLAGDELHHWGVGGDTVGRAAFGERRGVFLTAFPDFAIRADQTIAEDDLVASRWTATGTQQGEWLGIPPTGKSVKYTGINIFRIACGQIAESWGDADHLGLLRQLGGLPGLALPEEVEATPAPLTAGSTPCPPATPEENRAVAARWFKEAVNPGELERLGDVLSPDFVAHTTGFPDAVGPEAMVGVFQTLREGFPDLQFTVEPGPAEGDFVVERWTATGTNSAPFQGLGPTGQQLQWTGINIYRVECGRIVETWTEADTLGRLRQLGGLPPQGAATPAA